MSELSVLVVDDATFVRDMIKKSLREKLPGIILAEAQDGRKGQNTLKREKFDLILCDWEMPGMSGEELLRWIRQDNDHKSTPFIMVTSRGEKENLVTAAQLGVSDYLIKPFNNEILLQKVLKTLKKAGKLKPSHLKQKNIPITTGGFAADSVKLLTSNTTVVSATVFDDAVDLTPKIKSKSAKDKEALGQVQIRFNSTSHICIIKKISEQEMLGIIRRPASKMPSILENTVMDIAQPDDENNVARINGYFHQLVCSESHIDSRFITVTIRFVDDDPDKIAFLNRFIDMV